MKLSVITLTKNRSALLATHLAAIVGQTTPGDEVIIVDNGSTDETQKVIASFAQKLPIRAFEYRRKGLSDLYNYAIRKSVNPLILFYDDDCVASRGFLKAHRKAHGRGKPHVVQGNTYSLPKNNIYAQIMGDHYRDWLMIQKLPDGSMRTFDNKNASLPKELLHRFGMYDPSLNGGAEDIELGMRLVQNGVPILYDPACLAYHYERTSLAAFIRQHLRFASTDAMLAKTHPREKTVSMLHSQKITMHLVRAWRRELGYLKSGNIQNTLLLPLIYIILLFTRIWGYATAK